MEWVQSEAALLTSCESWAIKLISLILKNRNGTNPRTDFPGLQKKLNELVYVKSSHMVSASKHPVVFICSSQVRTDVILIIVLATKSLFLLTKVSHRDLHLCSESPA